MGEDSETVDGGRSSGSEPQRSRRDPKMIGLVAFLVVGVLAAVTAVLLSGGDEAAAPGDTAVEVTDPPPDSTPPTEPADDGTGLDGSAIGPGEVLLEPVSVPMVNAFSASMSTKADSSLTLELPELPIPTTSAPLEQGQVALAQVAGNEPGLYGGTRDVAACDPLQLTEFLEGNADKGAVWAEVQGIEPADIRDFVEGLTPVNLTRDTRVTNHGFVAGKAAPHQSVLQAGHSVFVDDFGVPRAKCSCGNPLAPPEPLTSAPTYVGDRWPGFDTTTIIVVIATVPVDGGFEVVDIETGEIITVPVGGFPNAAGEAGEQPDGDQSADGEPVEGPGETDEDLAVDLVNVGNIMGVTPGASSAATFTVDQPTLITSVQNYHYGPETPPGQVGLTNSDGAFYGPWQTVGIEGQGGVANAYWTATPYAVIPAGTYTVWDSEPSTWSTNADAGGIGFTVVQGLVGVLEPADDPGTMPGDATPPVTTEGPEIGRGDPEWSPAAAAGQTLDLLLLDCGVEYDPTFIDGGGDVNGWRWLVETPDGTADFFVGFTDGGDGWYVDANNRTAVDIAGRCGFLEVG